MRHLDCTEVCGKTFLGFERTGILLLFCLPVAFRSWLLHITSLMISLRRGFWEPWPLLSVVKPCVAAPLRSEPSFINIPANTALYPVSGDARESPTIARPRQKAALWRGRRGGRAEGPGSLSGLGPLCPNWISAGAGRSEGAAPTATRCYRPGRARRRQMTFKVRVVERDLIRYKCTRLQLY